MPTVFDALALAPRAGAAALFGGIVLGCVCLLISVAAGRD